ncbi:hypothetical protein [Candidatus Chlorohelix sp.]|uniref:hypothetical protein n=1 Tax=Candidatus Chlorohelix sp. TaxID=3139201 RepID=UPI0030542392
MPQKSFTSEEIKLRLQEDRFIQESRKSSERTSRARAVAEARKERAKKAQDETQGTL